MDIEPHSAAENPSTAAPINVRKIPACAAAPSKKLFGLAISGPKSVIVPIPRNIRGGYICSLTPRYKISRRPPSCNTCPKSILEALAHNSGWYIPASGRFVKNIPNEIGRRRSGSNCFTIARYIKTNDIRIIMPLFQSI